MFEPAPSAGRQDGQDDSSGPDAASRGTLFTVGHSNRPFEQFAALLRQHGVEVVADVRSSPWSRYVPQFNREVLQRLLADQGIKYVYLGGELGGKPQGAAFDGADPHTRAGRLDLYRRIMATPLFQEGIDRLVHGVTQYRVAVMCSEEDPAKCHRHHLVTPAVLARGVEVVHIRGDGSLEPARAPSAQAEPAESPQAAQLPLF